MTLTLRSWGTHCLLVLMFQFCSSVLFSQQIDKNFIVGKWISEPGPCYGCKHCSMKGDTSDCNLSNDKYIFYDDGKFTLSEAGIIIFEGTWKLKGATLICKGRNGFLAGDCNGKIKYHLTRISSTRMQAPYVWSGNKTHAEQYLPFKKVNNP